MVNLCSKLISQIEIRYQLTFLVPFNNYGEDNETITEIELPITLSIIHNLTQSELDDIEVQWILENGIKSVKLQESGWYFQRINTMGISFYKSGEINGSSYVKFP